MVRIRLFIFLVCTFSFAEIGLVRCVVVVLVCVVALCGCIPIFSPQHLTPWFSTSQIRLLMYEMYVLLWGWNLDNIFNLSKSSFVLAHFKRFIHSHSPTVTESCDLVPTSLLRLSFTLNWLIKSLISRASLLSSWEYRALLVQVLGSHSPQFPKIDIWVAKWGFCMHN